MGGVTQFVEENGVPVMSQKKMYGGRKIYFDVLMSHFKMLCMLILMRALMHTGSFHYS